MPTLRTHAEDLRAAATALAIAAGLYLASLYENYLLFHTLAELYCVVVACSLFAVLWNSRQFLDNGYFLFVGVAYLFVGVLDAIHLLAYKGMGVFAHPGADLGTQLWVGARYLESGSLLAGLIFLHRKPKPQMVLAGYAVVTGLLVALIFSGLFPRCFDEGTGLTTFKVASEYVICLVLALLSWLLWRRRREFDPLVFRLLFASVATTVASEIAFTAYVSAYGTANLVGHLLKVVSFYLFYKAFLEVGLKRPYLLLFHNLLEHQQRHRERIEEELAKVKDQLVRQTRLATLGQVAASIAHDLRNPLAVIRQAVYLLKRSGPDDRANWNQYTQVIDQEIDATGAIISNLMEVARSKEPVRQPVDLAAMVRERFARIGQDGCISCELTVDEDPFWIHADPVQFQQVVDNLLSNSVQAMAGSGRIRVDARRESGGSRIVVRDTGPGIPAEIRDQIFEPLVTSKPKGTGLGLAICRQVIQRHGGTIELAAGDGIGAAFEIRLPASMEKWAAPNTAEKSS